METEEFMDHLLSITKEITEQRGKTISWLQYAVKGQIGYSFLPEKEEQYKVMEEIIERAMEKDQSYSRGQISDLLFEVVHRTP